ncbi:MAG TPA: hypothetical protein DCS35_09815, partial [Vibrio sp.]|nr:hypothetical protein [Vibrio sp.]
MKKSALAIIINAVFLTGCNEDSLIVLSPDTESPDIGGPEIPAPTDYSFRLTAAGIPIVGALCNGIESVENG